MSWILTTDNPANLPKRNGDTQIPLTATDIRLVTAPPPLESDHDNIAPRPPSIPTKESVSDKDKESDSDTAIHTPSPAQLPGEIWCLTSFFNPAGYAARVRNFEVFYNHLRRHTDKIMVVELALTREDAVLHKIAGGANLIQIVESEQLWHKESLLNIGISKLPSECDKVVWMDADVIMGNEDWLENTARALEQYAIVQPFTFIANLPKGLYNPIGIDIESFPVKHGDCARAFGFILGIEAFQQTDGHPGFIWAARRSLLDRHRLYPECIIGGGDWFISRAATYRQYNMQLIQRYTKYHIASFLKWAQPFTEEINHSYYYVNNYGFHLYHGKIGKRGYDERAALLRDAVYNPTTDIYCKPNGLFGLTERGLRMKDKIERYFESRREDG